MLSGEREWTKSGAPMLYSAARYRKTITPQITTAKRSATTVWVCVLIEQVRCQKSGGIPCSDTRFDNFK